MGWLSVGVLAASVIFMAFSYLQHWWRTPVYPAAGLRPSEETSSDSSRKLDRKPLDPFEISDINDEHAGSDAEVDFKSTPKVGAVVNGSIPVVPTFNLDKNDDTEPEPGNAAERMKLPSKPNLSPAATQRNAVTSGLMPPPAVKASALRPLPQTGSSLNPPPSAASRLRGPPGASIQPSLGVSAASASTLPPGQRPSRKVILEPGHSPLDWAMLTRNPPTRTFLRGEDIPDHLIKVPPSELKKRNGRKGRDAWGTWEGKVYNLTPYVKFHPGGVGEIMRGAGRVGESERLFKEIHPWVNWDNMLGECLVGILVSEPDASSENTLESVD